MENPPQQVPSAPLRQCKGTGAANASPRPRHQLHWPQETWLLSLEACVTEKGPGNRSRLLYGHVDKSTVRHFCRRGCRPLPSQWHTQTSHRSDMRSDRNDSHGSSKSETTSARRSEDVEAQRYVYDDERKLGIISAAFLIVNKMIGAGSMLHLPNHRYEC